MSTATTPTDNIVRTGTVAALAQGLEYKLGRRVTVHRVQTEYHLPGVRGRRKTAIRYSLAIAGSSPPVFFNMTIGECKSRIAMLLDLIRSGVLHASPPGNGRQVLAEPEPSTGRTTLVPGSQGYSTLCGEGDDESPGADDRY